MKNEVMADLTHEMRSRMNAILGWAQLLKAGRISVGEVQQAADIIARNAAAQAKVLDALLDLNQVLAGKLHLEFQLVDLQSLVDGAVKEIRPALIAKGIRFKKLLAIDAGPVCGDATRLRLLLTHLLTSAIGLAAEGAHMEVELISLDQKVQLVVRLPGDVISDDQLNKIFQDAAPGLHPDESIGIGFMIVKNLVNLHRGNIGATSTDGGGGLEIVASFPVADPAVPAPAQDVDAWPDVDLSGSQILVIEDDPDSRVMIGLVLEGSGAMVTTAGSPSEALAMLEKGSFSLIVSDIGLPEMNGFELIREIRARGVKLPSIALTAYTSASDRKMALSSGFNMFVSKPVDAAELLRIVGRCADGEF
jgi:CheY-like chemotaxis protein